MFLRKIFTDPIYKCKYNKRTCHILVISQLDDDLERIILIMEFNYHDLCSNLSIKKGFSEI